MAKLYVLLTGALCSIISMRLFPLFNFFLADEDNHFSHVDKLKTLLREVDDTAYEHL